MITVVTGMPRTGTAMAMQMVQAAGTELYEGGGRDPDKFNERGYFESQKAKNIAADSSFLAECEGKAVKIICPHIQHLDLGYKYKVIFCERPLHETMASQDAVLGPADDEINLHSLWQAMERTIARAKTWLTETGIPYMRLPYVETVENPAEFAGQMKGYLDSDVHHSHIAAVIDPGLHHFSVE